MLPASRFPQAASRRERPAHALAPASLQPVIQGAEGGVPLAAARALMAAHRRGVALLYSDRPDFLAGYCPAAETAAELAALPGPFAAPTGGLWLARVEGRAAGVLGLRALAGASDVAELKRLYVPRYFRRLGLARALLNSALQRARAAGYRQVVLETGDRQHGAHALYRDLGFAPVAPFHRHPAAVQRHLHCLGLALA